MLSIIRNAILWLLVLLILAGCSGKKDSSTDGKTADAKKDSASDGKTVDLDKGNDLRTAKPDFTLTAQEFEQEKEKNRQASREKYRNKIVEMTGVVLTVGPFRLTLQVASRSEVGPWCRTRDREPWKKATPGQHVKLRGKGGVGGPDIMDCEILEVTGPPPVALTPDQLAKEFMADMDGVTKKYAKKYLLVRTLLAHLHRE